jgi:hypothetical protein
MRTLRLTISGILFLAAISVVLVRVNHERKQLSPFKTGIESLEWKDGTSSNETNKVTFVVKVGGELGNHVSSKHEALSSHCSATERFRLSSC